MAGDVTLIEPRQRGVRVLPKRMRVLDSPAIGVVGRVPRIGAPTEKPDLLRTRCLHSSKCRDSDDEKARANTACRLCTGPRAHDTRSSASNGCDQYLTP